MINATISLYKRLLMPVTEWLGIHDTISRLFDRVRSLYLDLHKRYGPATITHNISGVKVTYPIKTDWQHDRFYHLGEIHILEDMMAEMRPDDVFYDVGAYHGWHAVTAATAAPDSDVVAFEPHPMSHQQLCEVVDAIDADIRACQIALSDKNGTETIGETSEPRARLGNNADGIKIETVNGDQYITEQELPRPTVIKIDTEGMELNVLEGLRTNLESEDCRLVYCELHPTLAPQEDVEGSVIRLLEELGFECEKFTDESKNHLKAKKPE